MNRPMRLLLLAGLSGCIFVGSKETVPSPGIDVVPDTDAAMVSGPWQQVDAGGDHVCALNTSGQAACWGDDTYGQSSPPAGAFTSIAAGWSHTCVLDADGGARCFGRSDFGEAIPDPGGWVALAGGVSFTCGIDDDEGGVACWGFDASGRITPVDTTGLVAVSVGWDHVCAVTDTGAGVCFGVDDHGETQVPARTWQSLAVGKDVTCGVDDAGGLTCWGDPDSAVVTALPATGTYQAVSVGEAFACALGDDGVVACWGDASDGATEGPANVLTQVVAGHRYACGLDTEGELICWGAFPSFASR